MEKPDQGHHLLMYKDLTLLILAGGQGSRLGNVDKGLVELCAQPLIEYPLSQFQNQCVKTLISANRNQDFYQQHCDAVTGDDEKDYAGPLAGIQAGLELVETEFCFVIPCDLPFLPAEIIERMYEETGDLQINIAHDGDFPQPLVMLVRKQAGTSLTDYLRSGKRKVMDWVRTLDYKTTSFAEHPEWFDNINSRQDLEQAELRIKATHAN